MTKKKYAFLPAETIIIHGQSVIAHRIKALIDIPKYGVKIGDVGGYISAWNPQGENQRMLSDKGNCWIGGDAVIIGDVYISQDALVDGQAIIKADPILLKHAFSRRSIKPLFSLIFEATIIAWGYVKGESRITDNAVIEFLSIGTITDRSKIAGAANVVFAANGNYTNTFSNVKINDTAAITTSYSVYDCHFSGDAKIDRPRTNLRGLFISGERHKSLSQQDFEFRKFLDSDRSENTSTIRSNYKTLAVHPAKHNKIDKQAITASNNSDVFGPSLRALAQMSNKEWAQDVTSYKRALLGESSISQEGVSVKKLVSPMPQPGSSTDLATRGLQPILGDLSENIPNTAMERLRELELAFASYQDDVVNLIKYPAMSDMKNLDTLNFVHGLKKLQRLVSGDVSYDGATFETSIDKVERLFIIAESRAKVMMDSDVTERNRTKLKTVKQLLAIATDKDANEHEKKVSCERILKELKGLFPVSNAMIDNLHISAGLKKLEA